MVTIFLPLTVTAVMAGLLFSPVDFIPDVIPILGWTDDVLYVFIAVASWAFYFAGDSIFDIINLANNNTHLLIGSAIFVIIFMLLRRRR